MAVPVSYRNILKSFAADPGQPAWARDLVCLAILTNGQMTDAEKTIVWEECENGTAVPSQTIPPGIDTVFPKVELLKLKHHQGVNALAPNQEIVFCEEGITLLYGQNKSGKSGYFRVLNQLAKGSVNYTIHPNIYETAPPARSVSIEYKLDGTVQPTFTWDGIASTPLELRHIRCFDSKYATVFLQPRDGNTYLLESLQLQVFRAINETLRFLKEDMSATIPASTEAALRGLCSVAYFDKVKLALMNAFRQELAILGMRDLKVELEFDDMLKEKATFKIRLFNRMDTDAILSEAELKCAALALFLAECELMEVPQPMVFDDPVNSLDASFIQAFTNRLKSLPFEVVVFTHNVLFMEALTDTRQFKVYDDPATNRAGAVTPKKHILVYDVLINSTAVGYVLGRKEKKTLFYLDSANTRLHASGPITDVKGIVDDLRMAVEWCIDEVVFRGLAPYRFKGSEVTEWTTMEAMASAGVDNVRDLKKSFDQLSGMGIHLGYSSYTTPPTPAKLQDIHDDILRVFRTVYP